MNLPMPVMTCKRLRVNIPDRNPVGFAVTLSLSIQGFILGHKLPVRSFVGEPPGYQTQWK